MTVIRDKERGNRSPLPNVRRIIDYGPDCLPVYTDWQLLPDFRPCDDPRTAAIRIAVVRSDNGPVAVRVAALGLKHLGLRPADLVRAVMELIEKGEASLPESKAA